MLHNINGISNKLVFLILFISGALLPLAFAPVNLLPLAYFSPAIFFLFLLNATPKVAFWRAFIFSLGFFGIGVSWVFVAINEFGNTPLLLAAFMTFGFVAFISLVLGFQGMFSAWVLTQFKTSKHYLQIAVVIILPLIWVMFEWIRGTIFTGFPWLNLGYSQIDTSLTGFAPILGSYGLSWLVALCSGLFIMIWHYSCLYKWKQLTGFAFLIFSIFISGSLFNTIDWTHEIDKPLQVSLVQGNAPQITKWDQDKINERLNIYKDLTEQHWDSDIVIWPENSLTMFYHDLKDNYLDPLEAEALSHNTDLVIGIPVLDANNQYYSTFMSFGSSPGVYKKTHLVPFGEFIPFGEILRGLIAFLDLPMSGFSRGDLNQPLLKAGGQTLAVTICFEDVFGEEVIRQLPEATLLVNGSNNAWYGDSFAPHQHLQISRMRAVETGRELMRVTTNGISAFVNKNGELLQQSPQFKPFVLTGKVQPRTGATPFVRYGNWPMLFLFLIFIIIIFVHRKYYFIN
ncbi:MAG: apolipoprotein N-acyltransferase [Gammaproteobacteria bacterium]